MNVKNSLIRKGSLNNVCRVKILFIHLREVYFCRFEKILIVIIGPNEAVFDDYRQKKIFIFNNVSYILIEKTILRRMSLFTMILNG